MLEIKQSGNYKNIEGFFKRIVSEDLEHILEKYGLKGAEALASATPIDSGLTASSWGYEVRISRNFAQIWWTNTNIEGGVPIAILLEYGHATGNGAFVSGRDYINPAIGPIFNDIANEIWREVTRNG